MYCYDSVNTNNKNHFLDYIKCLSKDEQIEIFVAIEKLLEIKNNNQRMPEKLSKFISNGIFELRVRHTNKISRCLYFYIENKKIIFTNGFTKKQQKTPKSEIEKAIKLKLSFINNMKSQLESYKDELLEDPINRAKFILAKEKLNIELMLDIIDKASEENDKSILKRNIKKLRKHISTISLY